MVGPISDAAPATNELTEEQQTFVVQALACFDTPSEVAQQVKEVYGLELARQTVHYYDPTKGVKPAEKWCALFDATRKAFLEDVAGIAIAQRSYRLSRLDRMARAAESVKNFALAAQLHEQAAKEMGGSFTNHRQLHVDGQVQGGVLMVPTPVSAAEWAGIAAAQQASLPGAGGGTGPAAGGA